VFVRASFQDDEELEDTLGLTERVNAHMADLSARGRAAEVVFLDAEKYPDGVRIVGRYKVAGSAVTVTARVRRGERRWKLSVTGDRASLDELASRLVAEARRVAQTPD
jgi:hypothetical protein